MPKAFYRCLIMALGLLPTAGCVVHTIPVAATAAAMPTTSWVSQVQVRIAQPATASHVASASTTSWQLVQLKIGRLDGAMPILNVTFDPYDDPPDARTWDDLTPGRGYWIQADLVHVTPDGRQSVVGSGRLGGGDEQVTFLPGSNTVPIAVQAIVPGSRLDMAPTPLRRHAHADPDDLIQVTTSVSSAPIALPPSTPTVIHADAPVPDEPAWADSADEGDGSSDDEDDDGWVGDSDDSGSDDDALAYRQLP